jgi:hypothetical protein
MARAKLETVQKLSIVLSLLYLWSIDFSVRSSPQSFFAHVGLRISRLTFDDVTRSFIATLHPLFDSPQWESIYDVSAEFLERLRAVLVRAPPNPDTGHPQAMVTVFNSAHMRMAMNCMCSANATGIPPGFHVFVAFDSAAYEAMRPFKSELVLCDISARNMTVMNLQHFTHILCYHILLMGVDLLWSDADIIYIKNPMGLFRQDSLMEVSSNWADEDLHPGYDYTQFNIGFMRIISCQLSVLVWNSLIRVALTEPNLLEQTVMCDSLKPIRIVPNQTPIQRYTMKPRYGRDEVYSIRFYHPFEIMNSGLFVRNREHAFKTAREKGIRKPWAVHMAWLDETEKEPVITEANLWFYTDGRCISDPPGADFPTWKPLNQSRQ